MSGARLCSLLGELGYGAAEALDPDSFEWPFQYDDSRPILDWICSSLRPSNVLSLPELSQLRSSLSFCLSLFHVFLFALCLLPEKIRGTLTTLLLFSAVLFKIPGFYSISCRFDFIFLPTLMSLRCDSSREQLPNANVGSISHFFKYKLPFQWL